MINKGLFSKLYIDDLSSKQKVDDNAEGRMTTLSQTWQNKNAESLTDFRSMKSCSIFAMVLFLILKRAEKNTAKKSEKVFLKVQ